MGSRIGGKLGGLGLNQTSNNKTMSFDNHSHLVDKNGQGKLDYS